VKYKPKNDWTISDLSYDQRCHLAWRLDHKTYCGLINASNIARGNYQAANKKPIYKIFMDFDMTERAAKIHACKVINFELLK